MRKPVCNIASLMVVGLAFLLCGGCACTPEMKKFDVNVSLDDSLKDKDGKMPPVEVNIIGADATLLKRWMSKSVDEYWAQPTGLRSSQDKVVLTFGPDEKSKVLSKTDPKWDAWKAQGAMELVIIAFVPGMNGGGDGEIDPRRISLPLSSCRWKNTTTLDLLVSSSGIVSKSQPAPEEK